MNISVVTCHIFWWSISAIPSLIR